MTVSSPRGESVRGTEGDVQSVPPGSSKKQKGIIRRAIAYHVDGVAYRPGRDAFASGQQAVCYALAAKARVPRCRVEAGRMVADLLSDKNLGIRTYASRPTRVGRGLQRRALGHLEAQYGYRTDPGWLARLNEVVAEKLSLYDDKEKLDFARDPELYRAVILDRLMFGRRDRGKR